MRIVRDFILVLILAFTSCRSVPVHVSEAHKITKVETDAGFKIVADIINKIEAKSAELNNELLEATNEEWTTHLEKIYQNRLIVSKYLEKKESDLELNDAYKTGSLLLRDLDLNFESVVTYWKEMILEEHQVQADEFIRLFRRDMERYKVLERKFDEWISQFKVKG